MTQVNREALVAARAEPGLIRDRVALLKPGVTSMVVITACMGALLSGEALSLSSWLRLAGGVGAVVGAANVTNMMIERRTDALMERTRDRPLAAGRVSLAEAAIEALVLAASGLALLWSLRPLAALLGAIALVVYAALYTPLKRVTPRALEVGAIAGAMPPLMGWAAATGRLDSAGLFLFALQTVWQLPHFHAISLLRGPEYQRAGLAVGATGARVPMARHLLLATTVATSLLSLAAPLFGLGGPIYLAIALAVGARATQLAVRAHASDASPQDARRSFLFSMAHLAVLLPAMALR